MVKSETLAQIFAQFSLKRCRCCCWGQTSVCSFVCIQWTIFTPVKFFPVGHVTFPSSASSPLFASFWHFFEGPVFLIENRFIVRGLKAWRRQSANVLLTKFDGANVHHNMANLSYTISAPEDGSVVWFHQTNILAGRSTTFVIWGLNFKLYESGIK